MTVTINEKTLSVNEAWKGKRYKTDKYLAYRMLLLFDKYSKLPDTIKVPEGPLKIDFEFGFSNPCSDIDNPVKPLLDIMQEKYKFDDRQVYQMTLQKTLVKKGQEFFKFQISSLRT